ncbi:MAG: carbon-phosphorus lyase complex subunit PhnI [Hyphomicrobiales bacterium]|nr:carbon-phosphorus lyase complex subunit PhnI [Hyphomicrobiales bacterium]MDE2115637.1 carbon-phosphorus lyase complex subunit PhnI [Hyphomicrobiales bacterium]
MYVAVKGGEKAIKNAHQLLADRRRGKRDVPEISADQIREQLSLAVDRVMSEGSLYDRDLAALAIKQARGDLIEAIFLIRAYRATLPRLGYTQALSTATMQVERRISAIFKDLPGGQVLGPTFDYTHRLIDFKLAAEQEIASGVEAQAQPGAPMPKVASLLGEEGLIETASAADGEGDPTEMADITREPLSFPCGRDLRLQSLARADEGFLLALAYSTQRGYGRTHPFVGEIRVGAVDVEFFVEELGFEVPLGRLQVTECEMVNQFVGTDTLAPQFSTGYGLVFGHCERKAMSVALVERALRAEEFGETVQAPAQDAEFVLSHCDNVQAMGFVEHLKLPHYVDFQSELQLVRQLRKDFAARPAQGAEKASVK